MKIHVWLRFFKIPQSYFRKKYLMTFKFIDMKNIIKLCGNVVFLSLLLLTFNLEAQRQINPKSAKIEKADRSQERVKMERNSSNDRSFRSEPDRKIEKQSNAVIRDNDSRKTKNAESFSFSEDRRERNFDKSRSENRSRNLKRERSFSSDNSTSIVPENREIRRDRRFSKDSDNGNNRRSRSYDGKSLSSNTSDVEHSFDKHSRPYKKGYHYDVRTHRHYHDHYYHNYHYSYYARPVWGVYINVIPTWCNRVYVGRRAYYYYGGSFFEYTNDRRYRVVQPPVGAIVEYLPEDYNTFELRGEILYEVDRVIYADYYEDGYWVGYEVIGYVD